VNNPREDFETNVLGTLNLLEVARRYKNPPAFLYTSTNKVYGKMEDVGIQEVSGRYAYAKLMDGVSEKQPLDFHSPYGCSKGAADQYVHDYYRIYGIPSVVFRQSCIYGYHQFGIEDQGWVAWFTIAASLGHPITIYGDGKQVRDVLFVDDLVDAFLMAVKRLDQTKGRIYNIGGGPENQLSLLELIYSLESMLGRRAIYNFKDWRSGDQKVFVSNITKAKNELGWEPKTSVNDGVSRLCHWVNENIELFSCQHLHLLS
jgi:CDP-paratose 2-epimerase